MVPASYTADDGVILFRGAPIMLWPIIGPK